MERENMQNEEISLKIQTLETQYQLNIKRSSLISELKEKISEVKTIESPMIASFIWSFEGRPSLQQTNRQINLR